MAFLSIGFSPKKWSIQENGGNSNGLDIYEELNKLYLRFINKGIEIENEEKDADEVGAGVCVKYIRFNIKETTVEVKKKFIDDLAEVLYQIISLKIDGNIINKAIKEKYSYLKKDESAEICRRCMNILNGDYTSDDELLLYIDKKSFAINKIVEYLNENTDIILDGFVRFRLKEYFNKIESIVTKVVEEYLVEKEYNEFIKLLKYFVEMQESIIEIVNILINSEGKYYIYDCNGNDITNELLKDFAGLYDSRDMNCDDLLISSLITVAPRYVIIHNLHHTRNKELINTIKGIFGDRVKVCYGCELCISKTPINKL